MARAVTNDLGSQLIRGIHAACEAQQSERLTGLAAIEATVASTRRYWVRNTRTGQVLGSVWAAEEDEAMGKAQVKYGIALYSADGFTLSTGGANG